MNKNAMTSILWKNKKIVSLLLMILLSTCFFNFCARDDREETKEEICNISTLTFIKDQERGKSCDFCLATMLSYCKPMESKQLIEFKW
jgi:hypothetical protein